MNTKKILIDFNNAEKLHRELCALEVIERKSKELIILEALKEYLERREEDLIRYKMAEKTFSEWDPEDDK